MLEPCTIDSSVLISRGSKPRQRSKEVSHHENLTSEANNRDNIQYTLCKKIQTHQRQVLKIAQKA